MLTLPHTAVRGGIDPRFQLAVQKQRQDVAIKIQTDRLQKSSGQNYTELLVPIPDQVPSSCSTFSIVPILSLTLPGVKSHAQDIS